MGPVPARSHQALATRLERVGLDAGLDAVGIAPATPFLETRRTLRERKAAGLDGGMQFTYRNPDRATDPSRTLAGAAALVVGARSYRRADDHDAADDDADDHGDHNDHDDHDDHDDGGRKPRPRGAVARYSWSDHYAALRTALEAVAGELRGAGWAARVLADDNALVDREAAYRAGLGFYGKNTNLLLHGRGSEFVLGAVVTDAPLPTAPPPEPSTRGDGCGSCTRCLPACPTGALVAPGVLDARKCLAWLLQASGRFPAEHRIALGGRIYGCDDCQDACPPNRLEIRRRRPPPAPDDGEAHVDLVTLLDEPDDGVLLRRHGRWYIADREARYLRRNALVALGNVGDGDDGDTERVLRRHLGDGDAMIRAHAVWSAARLGRDDLLADLRCDERDPEVLAELGALPARREA